MQQRLHKTAKQSSALSAIRKFLGLIFYGTTYEELNAFISLNLHLAKQEERRLQYLNKRKGKRRRLPKN